LAYQWAQVFPDGKKLLVSGSYPGKPVRLYTQPVEGGALTPLEPAVSLEFFRISPDGARIAGVLSNNRRLAMIPATGGQPEILPVEPLRIPVKWSADGNRLLIRTHQDDGGMQMEWYDLKSGQTTLLRALHSPEGENAMFGNLAVANDDKTYVYAVQRRLSELFVVDGWK